MCIWNIFEMVGCSYDPVTIATMAYLSSPVIITVPGIHGWVWVIIAFLHPVEDHESKNI